MKKKHYSQFPINMHYCSNKEEFQTDEFLVFVSNEMRIPFLGFCVYQTDRRNSFYKENDQTKREFPYKHKMCYSKNRIFCVIHLEKNETKSSKNK